VRRARRIFLYIPFLALLVLILFSKTAVLRASQSVVTTVAWPFLKVTSFVPHKIKAFAQFWRDQGSLRRDTVALQQKVERLSMDLLEAEEVRKENDRLRGLLDFKKSSHQDAIAARVMGYDPSGWKQALLIDKGRRHGVEQNQPVISTQGVVGKVVQVGSVTSKVILLVDTRLRIGAVLEQSRDVGILEGQGSRQCRVVYLPKETAIEMGQNVFTSGLGGVFPKGLLLGHVVGAGLDRLGLTQYAQVAPAVPLSKLEEVLVLRVKE
jgi:rod shape-determining protein MreC